MSEVALRVEGLGKHYQLNRAQPRARYQTLQSELLALPRRAWARARGRLAPQETFWALQDVSFEVRQGEALGIIGRNGAGKSTLLKVLSRITAPSRGQVELYGRVGSLLEVGTGFHPELTGHENIYLSGAVLGMTRREVRRKLEEIIAFAGVEKFIDTPAKHYSSGMYMRLAFAVAAHLEPEILLVDEVLAVGDAEFQKKCLGKMEQVAGEGRTVLFVSHNMAAVQNLCRSGLLLSGGRITARGPVEAVISTYLAGTSELAQFDLSARPDRQGTGALRFRAVQLLNGTGEVVPAWRSGEPAALRVWLDDRAGQDLRNVHVAVAIDNHAGERIAYLGSDVTGDDFVRLPARAHSFDFHISRLPLTPGRYGYTLFSTVQGTIADWVQNAGEFEVEPGDFFGTGKLPPSGQGFFLIDHRICLSPEVE